MYVCMFFISTCVYTDVFFLINFDLMIYRIILLHSMHMHVQPIVHTHPNSYPSPNPMSKPILTVGYDIHLICNEIK